MLGETTTSDQMMGTSALVGTPHTMQIWSYLREERLTEDVGGIDIGEVALVILAVAA